MQLVVQDGGSCLDESDSSDEPNLFIIGPGQAHQIVRPVAMATVLFIESESAAGRAFRSMTMPSDEPTRAALRSLISEPLSADRVAVAGVVDRILALGGIGRQSPPDQARHVAVEAALALINRSVGPERFNAASVSARVGLSESRLRHVFTAEVGISMRAFVRWWRLIQATGLLASGMSMTAAAHEAGFADAAHFSRTFRQSFGLSPTEACQRRTAHPCTPLTPSEYRSGLDPQHRLRCWHRRSSPRGATLIRLVRERRGCRFRRVPMRRSSLSYRSGTRS